MGFFKGLFSSSSKKWVLSRLLEFLIGLTLPLAILLIYFLVTTDYGLYIIFAAVCWFFGWCCKIMWQESHENSNKKPKSR